MPPRNIMMDIDIDNSLTIPGILDWDSAVIAPKFVGCVPVMWIWAWNYGEDEKPIVRQKVQNNKSSNACLKKLLELNSPDTPMSQNIGLQGTYILSQWGK